MPFSTTAPDATDSSLPPVEPADLRGVRVALVHDWLTGMRGGEKVLDALLELVPDAAVFTLLHVAGAVSPRIEARRPRASFVQYLPAAKRRYRWYIGLFPTAVEQFDLDAFDLVLSTSHCAAKSVVATGRARHLCYCHTPMRYAWDQFDNYFGRQRVGPLRNRVFRLAFSRLARWDAATAGRVDRYVANSNHVAERIRRYYNRESTVVYPPVDTTFYCPNGSPPGSYFLIVSALVPYKRIDMAMEACRLAGVPLRIAGDGPERARLQALAGPGVEFVGWRSDEELRELYRGARAFLLPGEEDFGIAPVEALACGRPVVGLARGGVTETVSDGATGVLVDEPVAEAYAAGIARAAALPFDAEYIRKQALRFSRRRFHDEMRRLIEETARQVGGAAA
ncbi:MAG: glycosyltransferase [Acidobacteria bacterium]|nr:glycosyltransferase [Acidobacteriota bacterium]